MPSRPSTFQPRGVRTKVERDKEHDARRGSAHSRGYDGKWAKASAGHLRHDPLCRYCALGEIVTAATLVDHLYPHKGDRVLFWIKVWWVSSCKPCHDEFKQRVERKGKAALDNLAHRLGLPIREG